MSVDPTHRAPIRPRPRRVLTAWALLLSSVVIVGLTAASPTTVSAESPSVLASSAEHSCAILADGDIECWGSNQFGELGNGTTGNGTPTPQQVIGFTDDNVAVEVTAGRYNTCAIDDDAALWCWGNEVRVPDGPGFGDVTAPVEITSLPDVVDVSLGYTHGCAVRDPDGGGGTVHCWGDNSSGQLGVAVVTGDRVPQQVPGITDAVEVGAAGFGTCARHADGDVSCWGTPNASGEFGPLVSQQQHTSPQESGWTGVVSLDKGDSATCIILVGGTVECHGYAQVRGNDGDDNGVPVAGVTDPVQVTAVALAACAVQSNGVLMCWGNGDALGRPAEFFAHATDLFGFTDVVAASFGDTHLCIGRANGTVSCVGRSDFGEVGPTAASSLIDVPTPVSGVAAEALSVDEQHTCVRDTADRLVCFGDNLSGQSGGEPGGQPTAPTVLTSVGTVGAISAASGTSCGVDTNDDVQCVSDPDFTDQAFSTPITAYDRDQASGPPTSCVVTSGDVWCWGEGDLGQLGDGNGTDSSTPVQASFPGGTAAAVDVVTDGRTTCSRHSDGATFCWGANQAGQIGDDTQTQRNTPTAPTGLPAGAVDIDVDGSTTCVALTNGEAWCWGLSSYGKIGDSSSNEDRFTPVKVFESADAVIVAVTDDNACYGTSAGAVWCWGSRWSGVVGDGNADPGASGPGSREEEPVEITDFTADALDGDGDVMCALDGTDVWCWGDNVKGQAGQNNFAADPVEVALSGPSASTTTSSTELATTTSPTSPPSSDSSTSTTEPSDGSTTSVPGSADVDLFVPIGPARLLDTRPGAGTDDGIQAGVGRLAAGGQITVDVGGRVGIPDDALAVVVNITAVRADGVGYVTAHPCLSPPPTTSSLNYTSGVNLGNEVVAELDDAGNLCLFTASGTHLTVDVVAYLPAGAPYAAVGPLRLADTRTDGAADTVDGRFEAEGRLGAGATYRIGIAGRDVVPADAVAAVLNVTVIRAAGPGYFTVHPCLEPTPLAASLNYVAGVNRGNEIIAPLSRDGEICVFTSAAADLSVDVVGLLSGDGYTPVEPARFFDTRTDGSADTIDAEFEATGRVGAGQSVEVRIAGRGDVDPDAISATMNITAIGPAGVGYLTVHPCLDPAPTTASLNYVGGVNGGNEIVAELDEDGNVCIFTSAETDISIDVAGMTT